VFHSLEVYGDTAVFILHMKTFEIFIKYAIPHVIIFLEPCCKYYTFSFVITTDITLVDKLILFLCVFIHILLLEAGSK
jgi:hypothetical protein